MRQDAVPGSEVRPGTDGRLGGRLTDHPLVGASHCWSKIGEILVGKVGVGSRKAHLGWVKPLF